MMGQIFVYGLTFGGAGVALVRPYYGLLIYILFAVLRPDHLWHWVSLPSNSSRIVALATLIGWALTGFGSLRFGRAKACALLFVGFWLWALASTLLVAQNQERAFWYLETIAKILLPFLVGTTIITRMRQVRVLAWTIVGGLSYVAFELNLQYYGGYNRLRDIGFGSMDNNSFAIALDCVIGLALMLGLTSRYLWQKGIALLAAVIMMNAVFFSDSRGGMLGLMFTGLMAFLLIPKKPIHYAMFVVMLMVGFRLMGEEATNRFVTAFADAEERDESAQSRLDLWTDCFDVIQKNPIFGVGPENWGDVAPNYGWPQGKYAHSLWVQTGTETGLVGLGLLLGFYAVCIWQMWRMVYILPNIPEPLRDVGRMVIAALVGFAIPAQFVSLWGLEIPYYVVLLGAVAYKVAAYEAAEAEQEQWDEWRHEPALGWNTHPHGYPTPRYAPRPTETVIG